VNRAQKRLALYRSMGAGPDQPAQHSFSEKAQDDVDALPKLVLFPRNNLLILLDHAGTTVYTKGGGLALPSPEFTAPT
jgi:hypothetical protein